MSLIDLDQMFDLDLVLTTPSAATLHDSGGDDTSTPPKLQDEPNSSKQSHGVDQLPTVSGDSTITSVCTVCMEGFQSGVACGKRVPCGHVFHANCIEKWLSVQNSCPLCRFSVYAAGQGGSAIS